MLQSLIITIRPKLCRVFKVLFLIAIISPKPLFAQKTESGLAKVFYTYKHKIDTNNKDSVHTENMQLLIAENSSLFSSIDRLTQANSITKNIDDQKKAWTGPGLPKVIMPSDTRKITTVEIFQFPKEKKIVTKEYLIVNYLYEDSLERINWSLSPEVKSFGQINCQKANAVFKGRKWEAWFAPNLPFETGPWELQGLPGLIIEAYDSKREVQFLFNGFESLKSTENPSNNLISLPQKTVKVSKKDISKLKTVMYNNPKGFWEAQTILARGIIDPAEYAGFSAKKINNPIELPANK
jgi:GLPGLI family protein